MFQFHDIAGYNGKDVEVWVYNPYAGDSTPTTIGTDPKSLLRGAQSFEPTEEQPEERVSELGFEATKAIYGPADYGVSMGLLVRDLLQIARIAGNVSSTYIKVTAFQKVNLIAQYKDPNTGAVNLTKYAGGFKSRTASSPVAAGGNAEITLEGSADIAIAFDGAGEVVQHLGDGVEDEFSIPTDTLESEIVIVENPSGVIVDSSLYSYAAGVITFVTAPISGAVVRVVHTNVQTANIV